MALLFQLVLGILLFLLFAKLLWGNQELLEEDVAGSQGKEDGKKDAPRDVKLHSDKGADEDEKGDHHVVGAAEKGLAQSEGKADGEHDAGPVGVGEDEEGEADEEEGCRERLGSPM